MSRKTKYFLNKGTIKIYNEHYNGSARKIRLIKKNKEKMLPKLFQLSSDNKEKSELLIILKDKIMN